MTRKQELEGLIPISKRRIYNMSSINGFQAGLINLEEAKQVKEEAKYLVALMEEYDKLKDSDK